MHDSALIRWAIEDRGPFSGNGWEVIPVITREETIRRLEDVTREIVELRKALEEGWTEASSKDPRRLF